MLSARKVYDTARQDRKSLILSQPGIRADDDLGSARAISTVLNGFIDDYFGILVAEDGRRPGGSVLDLGNQEQAMREEIQKFRPLAIKKVQEAVPNSQDMKKHAGNIYEFSGARKLAAANKVTRNLSTTMGLLWERLANISPYSINPESEFGVKVKGIDLISRNVSSGLVEYQQVKTARNTLTGSQGGRSKQELSLHDHPVFCACFPLANWTFKSQSIPRVSGAEFWGRVGLDYGIVSRLTQELILELDRIFENV